MAMAGVARRGGVFARTACRVRGATAVAPAAGAASVSGHQARSKAVLASQLPADGDAWQRYADACKEQVQAVEALHDTCRKGGTNEKSKSRGNATKLFPRERLDLLLDDGSDFLEFGLLAGHGLYPEPVPCGGVITGVGTICGQQCMVVANDWTVKGGTFFPITVKKALRAQEIALENRLPCVYLVDSGGAFLPLQAELFADRDMGGRSFYNQAIMSSLSIPQVAVAMGHCTAGGAYTPAMSDEVVIVKGTGAIFLGGPPLVKAATGEEVAADDLGGADLHCEVSGVADHYAESDAHAMELVRDIVSTLNPAPDHQAIKRRTAAPPAVSADGLDALAGMALDTGRPAPAREVIARLVDGSEFKEFKARFGNGLCTGFAAIEGIPVGIIASDGDGRISAADAAKATHFVQLCDRRGVPMVFLQHSVEGGFTDVAQQRDTLVMKQAAKMMHAVAVTKVPKITVVTGGSSGEGVYALGGRAMQPRLMFMWPTAHVAAVPKAVVDVAAAQLLAGKEAAVAAIEDEKKRGRAQKMLAFEKARVAAMCTSVYSSARLWDDGVVAPTQTRATLAQALLACLQAPVKRHDGFGVFRV